MKKALIWTAWGFLAVIINTILQYVIGSSGGASYYGLGEIRQMALMRALVFVGIFGITWLVPKKLCEKYDESAVGHLVGWVTDHPSLFGALIRVKNSLGIPAEYSILAEERVSADIILKEYKKELMRKCGQKSLYNQGKLSEEEYFMQTLWEFLHEYGNQSSFMGYDMHAGVGEMDANGLTTYVLTDFAIIYFKMMYTAYCACQASRNIDPAGYYFRYSDWIKEILDTRQIKINQ